MKDRIHIHLTRDGYWAISNLDGTPTAIASSSNKRDLFQTLKHGVAAIRSANCVPVRDTGRDDRRWA